MHRWSTVSRSPQAFHDHSGHRRDSDSASDGLGVGWRKSVCGRPEGCEKQHRTKAASFRETKTLEDFDWSFNNEESLRDGRGLLWVRSPRDGRGSAPRAPDPNLAGWPFGVTVVRPPDAEQRSTAGGEA